MHLDPLLVFDLVLDLTQEIAKVMIEHFYAIR